MIILVINCGSSSIKYQLLDMKSDDVYDLLAKGVVEKIGLPEGILTHKPTGKAVLEKNLPIPDHKVGMQLLLDALVDPEYGVLKSFDDIWLPTIAPERVYTSTRSLADTMSLMLSTSPDAR